MLDNETLTFGKYKGNTLSIMLRDRGYCKWLLEQDFFQNNYEYLYNRVREYNPKQYFLNHIDNDTGGHFLNVYPYFNLKMVEDLEVELNQDEKTCYTMYLNEIRKLKDKITDRIDVEPNIYDIKAPSKWLKEFERDTGLKRDVLKEFLSAYELPNIAYIVEDIKKQGGIDYKGARSFKIAKQNSENQEKWWENVLKSKYGEDIGTQFKYENCFFDFININSSIIYECKLNIKDYKEDQYQKYLTILNKFNIIYLIGNDCVIDTCNRLIYTTDMSGKYALERTGTKFDELLDICKYVIVDDILECL